MIGFYAPGARYGHAVRCASMARHLPDSVVFSELTALPWAAEHVNRLPLSALATTSLECLVVDVFPLGLDGELRPIIEAHDIPLVFVYRHVKPGTVDLGPAAEFDRVILSEPGPLDGHLCCPIVVRDAEELLFPARQTGQLDALGLFTRWPLIERMPNYASMKANAGYNTFWESKVTAIPTEWSYRTLQYDDQRWRVENFDHLELATNHARKAAAVIAGVTYGKAA